MCCLQPVSLPQRYPPSWLLKPDVSGAVFEPHPREAVCNLCVRLLSPHALSENRVWLCGADLSSSCCGQFLHPLAWGPDDSLLLGVGAVLCILGCWPASLAFTHWTEGRTDSLAVTTTNVSRHGQMSSGRAKLPPVKNHSYGVFYGMNPSPLFYPAGMAILVVGYDNQAAVSILRHLFGWTWAHIPAGCPGGDCWVIGRYMLSFNGYC